MFKTLLLLTLAIVSMTELLSAQNADAPSLDLLAAKDDQPAVTTTADWERRRRRILSNMQTVMGPLPRPEEPVPLGVEILERKQLPFGYRQKIRYHTDNPEQWVHAWLFLPFDDAAPAPAILCLHQTTRIGKDEPAGLGGKQNLHYAYELAERGFVTLAPDYPSFGDSLDYDFEADDYISGTMKAIYDNIRAVDLLQSLPQVQKEKIGCIGHSLGGHNTMFTAAFEPRIKAMVSCCGYTRFHSYFNGNLQGWTSLRYMPKIAGEYDNDPDEVPFDFPEIIGTFAPRPFLSVSPVRDSNFDVSGVKDSISAAKPVYRLFDAEDNLRVIYPDCEHDFPPDARETAYKFFEDVLKGE